VAGELVGLVLGDEDEVVGVEAALAGAEVAAADDGDAGVDVVGAAEVGAEGTAGDRVGDARLEVVEGDQPGGSELMGDGRRGWSRGRGVGKVRGRIMSCGLGWCGRRRS
jgi:hypothetical protein